MKESIASASVDHESLLASIVDSCLEDIRENRPPAIEKYLAEYPELADELQAILPMLCAMGSGEQASPTASDMAAPTQLGDFAIEREIGRGGMGVVYRAEQLSLHRTVALKVLPFAAMLDPRDIERFRNEAQIAAQLHHPHIVPVYAVGSENGIHYYSMQLIEGQSVAELIRALSQAASTERDAAFSTLSQDLPSSAQSEAEAATKEPTAEVDTVRGLGDTTPPTAKENFRTIAQLGLQAAEALEYAHSVGLVHRDIKPSNLLLDRQGKLWVSDFGLAKVATSTQLTLTGDLVGTIAYMSPEQARGGGGRVDHRSDIYSLGATLYEMAALRRPFESRDRMELLQQVAHSQPRPLRQLNRAVPNDLETIVHKAMAPDAADRYETAEDFAADLRRFLESRPIHARRPSLVDRGGKWVQRHRVLVMLLTAFLLLTTVGSLAATGLVFKQKAATDTALLGQKQARERAEKQTLRAEQALAELEREQAATQEALAREQAALAEAEENQHELRLAVEQMYLAVSTATLANGPDMTYQEEQLLQKIYDYFDMFRVISPADSTIEFRMAEILHRMGEYRALRGDYDIALTHYLAAVKILRRFYAEDPNSFRRVEYLSKALLGLADLQYHRDEFDACRLTLDELEEIIAEKIGLSENYKFMLGALWLKDDRIRVNCLLAQGQLEPAEAYIETALERNNWSHIGPDDDHSYHAQLMLNLILVQADIHLLQNEYQEMLDCLKPTANLLAVCDKGAEPMPVGELHRELANYRGWAYYGLRQFAEAETQFRLSRDKALELAAADPASDTYRYYVASDGNCLVDMLLAQGKYDEAESLLEQFVAENSRLIEHNAHSDKFVHEYGTTHEHLAELSWMYDRPEAVIEHYQAAIVASRHILVNTPDHPFQEEILTRLCFMLAVFRTMTVHEEYRDAEVGYHLAVEVFRLQPTEGSSNTLLGIALYRTGKYQNACSVLNTSLQIDRKLRVEGRYFLAMAYMQLEQPEEARKQFDLAEEDYARHNKSDDRQVVSLRAEAQELLGIAEEAESAAEEQPQETPQEEPQATPE